MIKIKKYILILLIILCVFIALLLTLSNNNVSNHIYSHRGASGEKTEHTIEAYDLAISYGSKYIEQDIVISKDGTLYVSHDLSAKRITGTDSLYVDLKDEQIDNLKTKDGQSILKLSDVFDRYKSKDVTFVIELKSKTNAVDAFINLVDKYNFKDRIIVQCFELDVLKKLKEVYPDMPTLYLISKQENFDNALNLPYIDILSVDKQLLTKDNCEIAHKNGKEFNVWTLNSDEEIKKAIELGVDTYFTNYTNKAFQLERKYRK